MGIITERGDLLLSTGGAGPDRELEETLQRSSAARLAWLSPAGPGGVRASSDRLVGYARPTGSAGQATRGGKAHGRLTFHSGHLMGADHGRVRSSESRSAEEPAGARLIVSGSCCSEACAVFIYMSCHAARAAVRWR
jgi:hypothetical protein